MKRQISFINEMLSLLADTTAAAPHRDPLLQWALIAVAVATIFYTVFIRPMMKKKKDPLDKIAYVPSLSQQRNTERQMQSLLVELSEMTRQITAQLDTRSQKLQIMIEDADQRIATLQQLQSQPQPQLQPARAVPALPQHQPVPAWTAPAQIPIPDPIPDPVNDRHQQVYTLADQGRVAGEIAKELNKPRGEIELILALRPTAQRV